MGVEIEYRFLVKNDSWVDLKYDRYLEINQGYLSIDPERVVRVRDTYDTTTKSYHAYITVKGKKVGASAPEFEYEIPREEAKEILDSLCLAKVSKTRKRIPMGEDLYWEIDSFKGDLEGLIIAELEVPSEDNLRDIIMPSWIGADITKDHSYSNLNLGIVGIPYDSK